MNDNAPTGNVDKQCNKDKTYGSGTGCFHKTKTLLKKSENENNIKKG
jgi:hypothetical protein